MKRDYSKSNKSKHKFLGMPYGTASNRLKKMIMFSLLKKLHKDKCFRCGKKIETIDELSIDHKKPWLYVSTELFWDLDNIANSHTKCNRPHRFRGGGSLSRKVGPEGTAWCNVCEKFLPKKKFYSEARRWNGVRDKCIKCHLGLKRK